MCWTDLSSTLTVLSIYSYKRHPYINLFLSRLTSTSIFDLQTEIILRSMKANCAIRRHHITTCS